MHDVDTDEDTELAALCIADAHVVNKVCDWVYPPLMVVLLIIGLDAWNKGEATLVPVALIVAFTVLNVGLTRLGPRVWPGMTSDVVRSFVATPLAAVMYVTGEGPLYRSSLPMLVMVTGQALLLSLGLRSAWAGRLATIWGALLLLVAQLAVWGTAGLTDAIQDVLLVLSCGIITAEASANGANKVAEVRKQARHTDRLRIVAEKAMQRRSELQQRLVATSRQAGMAEVATGVLHNVGNVLNSVGVCSSTVDNTLAKTRLTTLERTVDLIRSQQDDLGTFFASDRGPKVLSALEMLTKKLRDEHRTIGDEAAQLRHHVHHIKTIVSRQQSFARGTALAESANASALVDDALALLGDSCVRHGIDVVRDVDDTTLEVDRARVLQILVNLLTNARDAVKDAPRKRIEVIAHRVGDSIEVAVVDTGSGIAAESMHGIFAHGFTTKENGHGFGLHSAANAAEEMGGTLRCESEGAGKGARFTLRLPLRSTDAIGSQRAA